MSLRRRFALVLSALFAVIVVVYASLTWWLAGSNVRGAIDDQLREQAAAASVLVRQDRRPPIGDFGDFGRGDFGGRRIDRLTETTFRVQFVLPDGTVEGDEQIPVDDDVVAAALGGEQPLRNVDIDGRTHRVIARGVDDTVVQVATDVDSIDDGLRGLRNGLVVMGLIGIGAAAVVGWIVARNLTRPIVDVTEAASTLAEGSELPEPIAADRDDEIGRLADSFNRLLSALEMSQEQQERLVADASHELRTPLTSLRLKIDFLRSEPDLPPDQRARVIEGASVELEALGDLVAELVDLAANSAADEPVAVVDLGDIVEEAARRARTTTHRDIVTSTSGTVVEARPTMVRRAIGNLIGNAVKYSPAGTPIDVVESGGDVSVRDRGPGFDDDARAHAFDRFYRSAGVQHVPGSGIGLAIVKRTADVHGGRVWIDDPDGGGAVVGFSVGEPVAGPVPTVRVES